MPLRKTGWRAREKEKSGENKDPAKSQLTVQAKKGVGCRGESWEAQVRKEVALHPFQEQSTGREAK